MGWPDSAIVCHAISNGLHSQGCTPRAAQPGLHTQGCTPGPSRPQLNSQASKALTTTQPARPLQLLSQQGLYQTPRPARPLLNSQASKAPTTAQPARPLQHTCPPLDVSEEEDLVGHAHAWGSLPACGLLHNPSSHPLAWEGARCRAACRGRCLL